MSDIPLPETTASPPGGGWRVGTLVYTTGGLVTLFCWLLWGDFAWALKDRSVTPVVQMLLRRFHASDLLASVLLVSLPQAIAIGLGPIISYKSDRHRGRFGRRIPFLLIPIPFAVLAIVGLAFSPNLGAALHHLLRARSPGSDRSVLFVFGTFWTLFEFAAIVANSVFGAFVNDVVPRAVICRFFGLFRAMSLIAGMVFNSYFFGLASKYYVWIFLGIGAIYAVGFSLMCLNVKEGAYPPPRIDEKKLSPMKAVRSYFRDCFAQPYYYWVFAAMILPALAFLPINTFNLYFAQSVGMENGTYGKLMAFYFFLSLLQTVPLGWVADKYHPLRLAMVGLVLHGSAALLGGLFIHDMKSFAVAFVATGTFSGTWFTATAAMSQILLPRLKFAQYASALTMTSSLATLLFAPCMGRFLDLSHHQYRYTYLAGFVLDVAGLTATIVVFKKMRFFGGSGSYVAPE